MIVKKRILITGASGFIGSRCAQALDSAQYQVRLAVRNIQHLSDTQKKFEKVVVQGLSSKTRWEEALQGCDCVIHTAGRAHVMKEMAHNPGLEYRRVNVEGTLTLAKQAVLAGVKRFIYISSIKVNGEMTEPGMPFHAHHVPSPKDLYAQSKYEAEIALRKLGEASGMEVVIIRPPLIYGPGVKGNFKIMLGWLQKGLPIPVTRLENKRSFVGINNLVDLINVCVEHPKAVNEVFLASDGYDLSTVELLRQIGRSMARSPKLLFLPSKALFFFLTTIGKKSLVERLYSSLQVDIGKNEALLGWKPQYLFQDMLDETVEDYLSAYAPIRDANKEHLFDID